MKGFKVYIASLSVLLLVGCVDYSGNTYQGSAVGEVSRSEYGTIVAIRDVKIKPDGGLGKGALIGGAAGAGMGALVGSAFNHKGIGAVVGGVAGAGAGHAVQNRSQTGKEYTVRLDNGNTISITQGATPPLELNQRVLVIDSQKGKGRVVPA